MAALKITKKHHKHINNPFPSTPKSLPFIQGSLFFDLQTLPSHQKYPIGRDFQLLWDSKNGGCLSISHRSQPTKFIWSTVEGEAFVSAALAETEVEESRGSFAFRDRNIRLVYDHQTIEDIRVIDQFQHWLDDRDHDLLSSYEGLDQKIVLEDSQFPVLLITGRIFNTQKKKKKQQLPDPAVYKDINLEFNCARYWVLFDQKNRHQLGFRVTIERPKIESQQRASPIARYQRFRRKLGWIRKKRLGWCWFFTRPRGFVAVSSLAEKEIGETKTADSMHFNRVCLTYSSERSERFYGFGEQFSHMDFKGKRVPIFVQEQGIGRGDQPITFAANLVSYR